MKYKAKHDGIRQLANSPAVAAATLAAAQVMAGNANAVGNSTYEAANTTVTVGWENERRAGAVVRESEHDYRDSRDAILLRVRDKMGHRGRR